MPKFRIIKDKTVVELFPKPKPFKNRRFHPWEEQTEAECAKLFHRPKRTYFYDTPIYPIFPITPLVNFDLNYK